MNRAETLLSVVERRGFVVLHQQGGLLVVASDQLIPHDRPSITRAKATLVRLLCERRFESAPER